MPQEAQTNQCVLAGPESQVDRILQATQAIQWLPHILETLFFLDILANRSGRCVHSHRAHLADLLTAKTNYTSVVVS